MNFVVNWSSKWCLRGRNIIQPLHRGITHSFSNRNDCCDMFMHGRRISTSLKGNISYAYTVTFKTGTQIGAGTDSNVYLRMIGEHGSSEELQLKTEIGHMERGMTDKYSVSSEDVGALKKIIVRHDNTGFGPAWYLEWIRVNDGRGKSYHFECNDWLDKESLSGNIRLLYEKNHRPNETVPVENAKMSVNMKTNTQPLSIDVDQSNDAEKDTSSDLKHLELLSESSTDLDLRDINNSHIVEYDLLIDEDSGEVQVTPFKEENVKTNENYVKSTKHRSSLSPAVRNLIELYGIDIGSVDPSGPHSRVLKGDVLSYISNKELKKIDFDSIKIDFDLVRAVSTEQDGSESVTLVGQPSDLIIPTSFNDNNMDHHYVDRLLTEDNIMLAESLKLGKFELPHLHMSATCYVDKLDAFVTSLNLLDVSRTRCIVLAQIFSLSLVHVNGLQSNVNEQLDILLNHNGNYFIVRNCRYAGLRSLANQLKFKTDNQISAPTYVLNVLDMEGVSQLSSVLQVGQAISVNFGGPLFSIGSSGGITKQVTLTASFDVGSFPEELSAMFLTNFNNYISNPDLLQI